MAAATPTGALVALHHVSFRFDDGVTLFDSLDLSIDRTPTGIVGRNGIGKSQLAQLIAGRCAPSTGTIERHTPVVYVAQQHDDGNAAANPRTVSQVAAVDAPLGALARLADGRAEPHDFDLIGDRWDLAERLRAALDAAGLHDVRADTPAHALSGGQRARVALIGALLSGAGLLVLDEPTNHLDAPGRAWLRAALDGWRGGLVIVSHDRALLADVQRIVELTPQGVRSYGGNYAFYRAQRDADQDAAQAALDNARAERGRARRRLEQEHDTIQRHAAASLRDAKTANLSSGAKQSRKGAARNIMGQVRRHQNDFKATLDERVQQAAARVEIDAPVLVSLPGTEVSARRQLFTLERARLPWLVASDTDGITWSASGPVRIALTGPNGCGKSTLLRMLAGELTPRSGACTTHVSAAYLDQRLALLDPERSIVEQLGLLDTPLAEGELRSRLALLQLDAARATQPARQLSGGERLKAALACALWRGTPAQLLLLDEPTNHLDLESVRAIEAALAGFPGAIVVASHDTAFLAALDPTHTMQWHRDGWRYEPVA
ncbi:ABC transporter ATP-binding protein [Burkholderia cepacia]|uniref:ABC-F family ATP-binding cassette domain-containing protein n=1 Tax=Burkholderia cepacia TaxID=292 RepID=UPI0007597076|nr:ATP-binding cassette domain-containing protein [Burkholderia cepacia]KVV57057.1 ABC transporter ATP-binding protein [Burkholderia cepacia]KVV59849.1 ABC transporter ATP-binding protein [Burkholderia cepacia]KVV76112.1 ABC transporter ATP-binding protein [Burkholderia cepacia]KVV88665.1 ABC transporter ATP-binding protein [Burkholderia cepacia]KVV95725.1 ABC transporter ATP-binding protein [Burkholderia cepacia]